MRTTIRVLLTLTAVLVLAPATAPASPEAPTELWVDARRGRAKARGSERSPLRSLVEALERVPDPVQQSVTIHLTGGSYREDKVLTGSLVLDRRMAEGVLVRIVGAPTADDDGRETGRPILDWAPGSPLVVVRGGRWAFDGIQLGDRRPRQRLGFEARGPVQLELKDVRIRVASHSGFGILAHRGALVELRGRIAINEDFHDEVPAGESFAGIAAEDHGIVRFRERDGASLSIGNGSLASGYGGFIRLGCAEAHVTSWGGQSNCIAVNNTGRVDLHGTTLHVRAALPSNTPIGLEDDGHVLAEGAHIVIECGEGGSGIVLQKASTLYCGAIEMRGSPKYTLLASSGSNFVGAFLGDVYAVHATTGATIALGDGKGRLEGPFQASRGGTLSLPDGTTLREELR